MRHRRTVVAFALTLAIVITAVITTVREASAAQAPPEAGANLGRVELPNSGAPAAQEPFLRGLAALHSFWYDEAADLFREAQALDPGFALAYWGEAMTYNHPLWNQHDGDGGRAVLARLAPTREERAAKAGSERERGYLATAEVLYDPVLTDKAARDRAYAESWQRLYEAVPADLEAKSFYALSLQGLGGEEELRQRMRSAALVEEVFAVNPLHPGAAHYLIHAYDDPVHAPLGLRAAEVYASIAPAANHALHMPSHIFVQLGLWERVAASNVDAYEASVAWVERRGHPAFKRDFHSLSWLQYAYLQMGRYREAAETIETIRAVAQQSDDARTRNAYHWMVAAQVVETGQPYTAGSGAAKLAMADDPVAPEAATEAATEAAIVAAMEHDDASMHCAVFSYDEHDRMTSFAAAFAAVRAGDLAAAREAAGMLALATEEGEGEEPADKARRLIVAALIAQADGDTEATLGAAAEAVAAELEMRPPSGPPDTVKPAHELYGELLLAAGRAEDAAKQFHQSLLRTPRRTRSLLGAARAAAALGDGAAAREHYAQALDNLANADSGNPAVAEASGFLSQSEEQRPAP
jgi:hypothetical protein